MGGTRTGFSLGGSWLGRSLGLALGACSFGELEGSPVACIWGVGFGRGLEVLMVWGDCGLELDPLVEFGESCGLIREARSGLWGVGLPQIGGLVWGELDLAPI